MSEILFASDLDNTLLFSCKHKRDTDQCVEWLEGKEQGFFTLRTLELLPLVCERVRFVPVTTRSVVQYQRILWPGSCAPRYAVTSNGGVLLNNGRIDQDWYEETKRLVLPWQSELLRLEGKLREIPIPKRCRVVDEVYLFAAFDNGEEAEYAAGLLREGTALETAVSGRKVYFFPPSINKGDALRCLRERFQLDKTICAGDSVIDLPMLRAADLAIVPSRELLLDRAAENVRIPGKTDRFPDFILKTVLEEFGTFAPKTETQKKNSALPGQT